MTVVDAGTAVIVFARAPSPGTVKTRLIPLLGAEGAAALHARLVEKTLETAHAAAFPRIELHGTPGIDDPFLRSCGARFAAALVAQAGDDLGARMHSAFESALAARPRALLVGSDCPALTARHLRQADRALRDGADAVLVPCEDGGYALIGLTRADARLFDGIAWGGGTVMAGTRARLSELGWRWRELETLWDVDRPDDYARLIDSGLLDDRCTIEASFPRRRESS
ncbi:MAG: TIGR04282 family arsenosugar biosynthesis glycosyltransferase [Burkholderiales bacterium]